MSLLKAPVVKNSDILAAMYFIFVKNVLEQLASLSIPKLDLTGKIRKEVIK